MTTNASEKSDRVLKNLKIEQYNPTITLLGIYRDICTFVLVASLFTLAKKQD